MEATGADVTCPVCGKTVGLEVATCPYCGAEFEEGEVEEVIEERVVSAAPAPAGPVFDRRVFGIALIILGIVGTQISIQLDWYYQWVPPIGENLGLFALIGVAVLAAGLGIFLALKRRAQGGREVTVFVRSLSLAVFIVGIVTLALFLAWDPVNEAIASNQSVAGAVFFVLFLVGLALVVLARRAPAVPATPS